MIHIRAKSLIIMTLLGCSMLVHSCKKDDGPSNETESILKSGTWYIFLYKNAGTDETMLFSGYNFTFNDSGNLNANNGVNDFNGQWSITDEATATAENLYLNISFSLTNDFANLNNSWYLLSRSSNKIELNDLTNNNLGSHYLTFQKN